jgi:predicted nucleotidyltransferase
MDRWIEVARRRRLEIAKALAEFVMDRCRTGDVALFGSRARGDFHDMSDWDIAVVVEDGEYAVTSEEFGQVVYIPATKLDQLLAFSMVLLDVAHDGYLLCGKGDLWHEFVKKAWQYVKEKKLEKTRAGWYPAV